MKAEQLAEYDPSIYTNLERAKTSGETKTAYQKAINKLNQQQNKNGARRRMTLQDVMKAPAHINPREQQALGVPAAPFPGNRGDNLMAMLTPSQMGGLKRAGGAGTTNPATGARQFFGVGSWGDSGGDTYDYGETDEGYGGDVSFDPTPQTYTSPTFTSPSVSYDYGGEGETLSPVAMQKSLETKRLFEERGGFSPEVAAGLAANFANETRFDPANARFATRDMGFTPLGVKRSPETALGHGQWQGDRAKDFIGFVDRYAQGQPTFDTTLGAAAPDLNEYYADPGVNVDFTLGELEKFPGVLNQLRSGDLTPGKYAEVIGDQYLKGIRGNRANFAEQIFGASQAGGPSVPGTPQDPGDEFAGVKTPSEPFVDPRENLERRFIDPDRPFDLTPEERRDFVETERRGFEDFGGNLSQAAKLLATQPVNAFQHVLRGLSPETTGWRNPYNPFLTQPSARAAQEYLDAQAGMAAVGGTTGRHDIPPGTPTDTPLYSDALGTDLRIPTPAVNRNLIEKFGPTRGDFTPYDVDREFEGTVPYTDTVRGTPPGSEMTLDDIIPPDFDEFVGEDPTGAMRTDAEKFADEMERRSLERYYRGPEDDRGYRETPAAPLVSATGGGTTKMEGTTPGIEQAIKDKQIRDLGLDMGRGWRGESGSDELMDVYTDAIRKSGGDAALAERIFYEAATRMEGGPPQRAAQPGGPGETPAAPGEKPTGETPTGETPVDFWPGGIPKPTGEKAGTTGHNPDLSPEQNAYLKSINRNPLNFYFFSATGKLVHGPTNRAIDDDMTLDQSEVLFKGKDAYIPKSWIPGGTTVDTSTPDGREDAQNAAKKSLEAQGFKDDFTPYDGVPVGGLIGGLINYASRTVIGTITNSDGKGMHVHKDGSVTYVSPEDDPSYVDPGGGENAPPPTPFQPAPAAAPAPAPAPAERLEMPEGLNLTGDDLQQATQLATVGVAGGQGAGIARSEEGIAFFKQQLRDLFGSGGQLEEGPVPPIVSQFLAEVVGLPFGQVTEVGDLLSAIE